LAVDGDGDAARPGAFRLNELNRFAYRSSGGNDVIDNEHIALQGSADDSAAFAMHLGFLAIEGKRHIATLPGKGNRDTRYQWNTLIGWTEQHVESDAGIRDRPRVEFTQPQQAFAVIEQPGIEKIGAQSPRFGLEFAETQDLLL